MQPRDPRDPSDNMRTLTLLVLASWIVIVLLAVWVWPARALDYEIWAERAGAELRADQPNIRRLDASAIPFASRHDCLEAIALSKAEKGWRLRCRPAEAEPVPRLVVK